MQMQMLKTSLEWLTEQQIRFDLYNWFFARKASVSFLSSQPKVGWTVIYKVFLSQKKNNWTVLFGGSLSQKQANLAWTQHGLPQTLSLGAETIP